MDRKWTYQDESGAEFGPYTREELLIYSEQGRISRKGRIREEGGQWVATSELLPPPRETAFESTASPEAQANTAEVPPAPPTPPVEQASAAAINSSMKHRDISKHPRILYILLGITLPLCACGLAGVNNLIVGRSAIGATQLTLSLCGILLNTAGIILGVTYCIGIPLWAGILLWSILEAATNELDGEGRLMR